MWTAAVISDRIFLYVRLGVPPIRKRPRSLVWRVGNPAGESLFKIAFALARFQIPFASKRFGSG